VVQATITQDHFYLKIVQSKTEDGKTTIYPKRDIVVNPQELQPRFDNVTRLEETTNSNNQEEILSLCRSKNNLENNQSELRNSTGPKPDIGITPPVYAGYQLCQTRGLIVIDTSYDSKGNKKSVDHGLVAVLPFRMTHVSSVILTVKEGEFLEKGQNISYFQFGGSDTVTVFQKRPTYRDGLEAGKTKLHIRERIAEWK
jgi:Phosphatidylserine decarboxylase